jgi:hypothetical protein
MVFDKCVIDVFGKQTISQKIYILIYRSKRPGPPKEFGYPFSSLETRQEKGRPSAFLGVILLCCYHLPLASLRGKLAGLC